MEASESTVDRTEVPSLRSCRGPPAWVENERATVEIGDLRKHPLSLETAGIIHTCECLGLGKCSLPAGTILLVVVLGFCGEAGEVQLGGLASDATGITANPSGQKTIIGPLCT